MLKHVFLFTLGMMACSLHVHAGSSQNSAAFAQCSYEPADTLTPISWRPTPPGGPIKPNKGRSAAALPSASCGDGVLYFTAPMSMTLPYCIYRDETEVMAEGTLVITRGETTELPLGALPGGTYCIGICLGENWYTGEFLVD